jgi:hypothetical protein
MKTDKLDDHLVEPETRWEIIDGARVQTPPAQPPQAGRHFTMNYAIGAHLAPGYLGASDLLTRWSSDNDYATDTSVRRVGIDEATGERYLEEMVFDVVDAQQREDLDKRAHLLSRRGVRRIFAVFAKEATAASPTTRAHVRFNASSTVDLPAPLSPRSNAIWGNAIWKFTRQRKLSDVHAGDHGWHSRQGA